MHILIFIISAIILYPILGTVFGIILTIYKSDNEKLKVGIFTFLHPLIYTILLWLIFPWVFSNSLLLVGFYLFAVLVRDTVFSDRKYLSGLTVSDQHIS